MAPFETAHQKVRTLITDFLANEGYYRGPDYQESELRDDFLDKFWMALGWDVRHENQKNPYEQEVKVENRVSVAGAIAQKKADYAFFIAPNFRDPRFFCEAKKPSVNLDTDADGAFQTIRYGFSAGTPVAVLSHFGSFRVVDCRIRPNIDTALSRNIRIFTCAEFANAEKFAEFYYIFSREAFATGKFEVFVSQLASPRKVGTQLALLRGIAIRDFDEEFLSDLEEERATLAKMLKRLNQELDGPQLTEIITRILDRLVFLRFLEDKLIETEYRVADFARTAPGEAWFAFIGACERLNTRYNGVVFKYHDWIDDRQALRVDDGEFSGLCEKLGHLRSPYNFSVIPVHILGSIYERFLGQVIVVTGKTAKPEQKHDVRKAGGVYYTPEYVVRYICDKTIGPIIRGKSPIEVSKLRFGDIACGSGSFLISVYELLLEHHARWYNEHKAEALDERVQIGVVRRKPEFVSAVVERDGGLRLTLEKKRQILLNNIFGVDIDPQAREVAQLSLYLKLLEDETTATARQSYLAFHAALLPSLEGNIKCGNSVVGTDAVIGELQLDDREARLKPLDFSTAFQKVMPAGGFHAIVGNPPYRREKDFKTLLDEIALGSFGRRFRVARMDLWYYFVHRALEILARRGRLGYIVNAYWTSGTGAKKLIEALKSEAHVDEIFFLGKLKVFEHVSGQHMVLLVSKGRSSSPSRIRLVQPHGERTAEPFFTGNGAVEDFRKPLNQVFVQGKVDLQPVVGELLDKLEKQPQLITIAKIRQGIAENPASINRKTIERFKGKWQVGQGVFALRRTELSRLHLTDEEKEIMRPYYDARDIRRFDLGVASLRLIYSTANTWSKLDSFPNLRDHLLPFKRIMDARRETASGSNKWWQLHWPREEAIWETSKILAVQMSDRPAFAAAFGSVYVPFSINVVVPKDTSVANVQYLTGILNSKLLWKWFHHRAKRRGANLEINGNVLRRAPIRKINHRNASDRAAFEQVVRLAEAASEARRQISGAKSESDRDYFESKATAVDDQLDDVVYALYRLTSDEKAAVRASVGGV